MSRLQKLSFALAAFAIPGMLHAQATQLGVGIAIESSADGVRIAAVAAVSPAERAGLHARDIIVAVDDKMTAKLGLSEVTGLIRGPMGSAVKLSIATPGGVLRTVTLVRSMKITDAPAAAAPVAAATRAATPASVPRSEPAAPLRAAPASAAVSAPAPAPAAAEISFVSWAEPTQHAYTIDVPAGWTVSGGMNWTGPIDAQNYMQVASPDGKVKVFIGDPEFTPNQTPTAASIIQTGVREGGTFKTPSGGRARLLRYQTGTQFGKAHVTARICPSARFVSEKDLPDLAREFNTAMQPEAAKYGMTMQTTAGEAGFFCDAAQGVVTATTFIGGARTGGPVQIWVAANVGVFVSADPARAMQARFVMEHMLATLKADPRWESAYEERVRQVTGSVISMQNANFQSQQNASARASSTLTSLNHPNLGVSVRPGSTRSSGVNTTLGTKDVCDAIGRCKNVSNDAESIYMDHSGNVRAGSAGGGPPDNSGVWSPTYVRP